MFSIEPLKNFAQDLQFMAVLKLYLYEFAWSFNEKKHIWNQNVFVILYSIILLVWFKNYIYVLSCKLRF